MAMVDSLASGSQDPTTITGGSYPTIQTNAPFRQDYELETNEEPLTPLETEANLLDINERSLANSERQSDLVLNALSVSVFPPSPTIENEREGSLHQPQPEVGPSDQSSTIPVANFIAERPVVSTSSSPGHPSRHVRVQSRSHSLGPSASTPAPDRAPVPTQQGFSPLRQVTKLRTRVQELFVPTKPASTSRVGTMLRILYMYSFLYLPALYYTRVAKIFEDARVSREEVKRVAQSRDGVDTTATQDNPKTRPSPRHVRSSSVMTPPHWTLPTPPDDFIPLSPALTRFKESWEAFIDSLMREWKTLNLVSALLLTAILTLFQIPNVNTDPVIRNTSFLSLICALMSLSYGCTYIIRFGSFRNISRALSFADKAEEFKNSVWWNVYIFLAIPSVWLAWSMMWFIVTILAYVWRSGAEDNPDQFPRLTFNMALVPRIIITAHFVLGLVYFALVLWTLATYGSLKEWVEYEEGKVEVTYADADAAERGEARNIDIVEVETGRKTSILGLTNVQSRTE